MGHRLEAKALSFLHEREEVANPLCEVKHNPLVSTAQAVPVTKPPWGRILLLWTLAILALILHLGAGSADSGKPFLIRIGPIQVIQHVFEGPLPATAAVPDAWRTDNDIIWQIRLPRGLACLLAGAILAVVGTAFQALFRNPLAEPYIVGVSSGAAVGGSLALVLGVADWAGGLGLMALAFAGGAASLLLVLALAGKRGRTDVQALLLSGVVIGAMLSSILSVILFAANQDANVLLRWMLGSASFIAWDKIAFLAGTLLLGSAILIPQGKKLNALAMSEDTAQRLGVDAAKLKSTLLLTGTGMAAITVGSIGVIGFMGLVAPHIARRILGIDWRWTLIGASAIGSTLLVVADLLAQRLVPGGELPVGAVTAIFGVPVLILLMRRQQN
jgi:iron complex transport system permease protein